METEISGTLLPDGTISLDQKPDLPSGRVTVVVRPLVVKSEPLSATGNWWQALQQARKEMEEGGCVFLNEEQMKAAVDFLREGDSIDEFLNREEPKSP